MTTTLPEPAGPAAQTARALGQDMEQVRREAHRLASLPRTWEPTVAELLSESSTFDPPADLPPAALTRPTEAPRPTLADLDAALDEIATIEAQVAALHGRRAVLVAGAVALAEALEADIVDATDPVAQRAPSLRRLDLARRAVVAEIATTLHLGEHAVGTLADHATTLHTLAPRTMGALRRGELSWAHAAQVAKHVAGLEPHEAARVESTILLTASSCTPGQLAARARRAREEAHPVPADVRHAEAAEHRAVYLDDGRDGMAWLTAHLPATLAHAAYDRLVRTASHLTADGDPRTPGQARADVCAALLLDDGSLDLRTSTLDAAGEGALSLTATDHVAGPASDVATEPSAAEIDAADDALERHARLPRSPSLAALARSIRPRVTVTVPVLTLLGYGDAPATLDGQVPVDGGTARELTALAPSLRRILTHPETGVVLSVGRTAYAVPRDLKALVEERDRTCRFPGCGRLAAGADLDHTTAWADGGATEATNLALLCRHHHLLKHQTRWAVRQLPGRSPLDSSTAGSTPFGGTLEWVSPTGRVRRTSPCRTETTCHRTPPRLTLPPPDDAGGQPSSQPSSHPSSQPGDDLDTPPF